MINADEHDQASKGRGSGRRPRRAILLVEDNDDLRELLVLAFELSGFDVHAAASAREGLDLLHEKAIDFVVTDFNLGDATGLWMLEQAAFSGLLDDAGAILYTAHPTVRPSPALYPVRVIRKPFEVDMLIGEVESALGRPSQCHIGVAGAAGRTTPPSSTQL